MLIRNHAEAAVVGKKENLSNMVGYNFRLGEIEAAIGIEQLKKLNKFIKNRQAAAKFLTKIFKIRIFTNSYCFKIQYSCLLYLSTNFGRKKLKIKRSIIVKALRAEGLEGISEGYANLHLLPLFQKIAFENKAFLEFDICSREISYKKGICPIAEDLHDNSLISFEMCLFSLNKRIKFNY